MPFEIMTYQSLWMAILDVGNTKSSWYLSVLEGHQQRWRLVALGDPSHTVNY